MIPADYSGFLAAATQASAALIGLLFVSVSLHPEKVFGATAEARPRVLALSSFTALANVFFTSFGTLIPHLSYGYVVVIAGVIAESQTLALLEWRRDWRSVGLLRALTLFVASAAIYGYEIIIGIHLIASPSDTGALTGLLEVLLGAFAIGLARAWQLLGAPAERGAGLGVLRWLRSRLGRRDAQPQPPSAHPPPTAGL